MICSSPDKNSVINAGAETETDNLERSSSASSDPVPQAAFPVPYRRSSAAAAPYLEDSHFWTPPPPQYSGNASDSSENYIPLDECLSGSRGGSRGQPRSLPKLVPRDIHLLDRVPPSPSSLTQNPVGLSGMPEVYAPMVSRSLVGPPSLSPRLASRGGDGGPRRNQQTTLLGQCIVKRDQPHGSEGSASPSHKAADIRNNNNTCFNFKTDHGRLVNTRSDPKAAGRVPYSSVSSEASLTDPTRPPCCPSRPPAVDSHSVASDSPNYRNIPNGRIVDRPCVFNQQSLPLTMNESRDFPNRQNNAGTMPRMTVGTSGAEPLRSPRTGHGASDSLGHSFSLGHHASLDSKILHMTPPAPAQSINNINNTSNSKPKVHKYVNANGNGAGGGGGGPREGPDSCHSTPSYSEDAGGLPPTASNGQTNDSDGYYNLIPTNGQSGKAENGG